MIVSYASDPQMRADMFFLPVRVRGDFGKNVWLEKAPAATALVLTRYRSEQDPSVAGDQPSFLDWNDVNRRRCAPLLATAISRLRPAAESSRSRAELASARGFVEPKLQRGTTAVECKYHVFTPIAKS
jgi:hypothetical protein